MRRLGIGILVAGLCSIPALVLAGGGGGHHNEGIPFGSLFFAAVNLVLFLLVLRRFLVPTVKQWVADRRTNIVQALEEAATARAEALALRKQWEERLAQLEQTVKEMQADAQRDAERDAARIIAAAEQAAETIRNDAVRQAEMEAQQVEMRLREELVADAVQRARTVVQSQWTAQDQERSIGEFLQQVQ